MTHAGKNSLGVEVECLRNWEAGALTLLLVDTTYKIKVSNKQISFRISVLGRGYPWQKKVGLAKQLTGHPWQLEEKAKKREGKAQSPTISGRRNLRAGER